MHSLHLGPGEMRNVFDSGLSETVRLVVDEDAYRTTQGHDIVAGRRVESGDQAPKVGNQYKQPQGHQKWREPLTVRANDTVALVFDKSMKSLDHMLQTAWTLYRKPRAQYQENHQQEGKNQNLHGESVADGRLRIFRLDPQRHEQRGHRAVEGAVQNFRKPELFRHERQLLASKT